MICEHVNVFTKNLFLIYFLKVNIKIASDNNFIVICFRCIQNLSKFIDKFIVLF